MPGRKTERGACANYKSAASSWGRAGVFGSGQGRQRALGAGSLGWRGAEPVPGRLEKPWDVLQALLLLAAGSEHWTLANAQTPPRHCGWRVELGCFFLFLGRALLAAHRLQSCCIFTTVFSRWMITSSEFALFQS